MYTVKNLQENSKGNILCERLDGKSWINFVMPPSAEYEISEESDWPEVKPCDQATKDAHKQAEAMNQAVSTVQAMLDTEAQSRDYDDINSIGKYVGYDNEFRAESEALGAWAAACWTKSKELQAGGVMPDDLMAEMPVMVYDNA
tara:strand:+ start:139 stop:570 length:432 start_codon:yes stop_codon:yes gene_type:complete